MKKFSTRVLAAAVVMTLASGSQAFADFDYDNISFRPTSTDECAVTSHAPLYSGNVVIPDKATDPSTGKTYTVTAINSFAFEDCADMTSVTLPETLVLIDSRAFFYCTGLTSITLPASLQQLEFHAFGYCSNLEAINVAEGSEYFKSIDGIVYDKAGEVLVMSPEKVTEVTVPDGVKEIGYAAFYNNTELVSVTLPEGVERISTGAFQQCTALSSINIPTTCEYIGGWAFDQCAGLIDFDCGEGLKTIDSAAFQYCSNLVTFHGSDTLEYIGQSAFMGALSLRSVYLGKSLTYISFDAFSSSEDLEEIILLAPVAPEAEADAFTDEQFDTVTLYLAEEYMTAYDDAYPWYCFMDIRPYSTRVATPAAESSLEVTVEAGTIRATADGELLLYTADGRLLSRAQRTLQTAPGKGLYILKTGDETRKVLL